MAPKTIGRFKIGKKLGSGNQGTVYLCSDTELQRRVAIKLLNKSLPQASYRSEARTMSKLQHPNIVSIYEAGEHKGTPFLVFEYVEGRLLSDLIRDGGLELAQIENIFQGLLAGVSRAHQAGIVHRDLKPTNIIINGEQMPKIMDFGIARLLSGGKEQDEVLIGSPRYMAPEYISKGQVGPQADVFALGLILDEMLTGMPVFNGRNQQVVLDNILNMEVKPPSQFNQMVDERLDRFVLKALEKDPDARYADAEDMLNAFGALRKSPAESEAVGDAGHGTVDFLLRRMRRKSDFPALSQSVRSINAMAQVSDKDLNQLAGVIVNDFALTNKILKVVNSAFYGRFSGKIGTVSRAVVVLGMQTIRSLAASLIFFEHLQDKEQAERLREMISSSLFSATLASQVAKDIDNQAFEEYFLAAMLHDLGKILIAFYLHDESREIEWMMQQEAKTAVQAEHAVLGVTFEQVGIEIAKQWNFPKGLTASMESWNDDRKPATVIERRRMVAAFSKDATQVMAEQGLADKTAVTTLMQKYKAGLGLDRRKFKRLADQALEEFQEFSKVLSKDISQSFVKKISGDGAVQQKAEKRAAAKAKSAAKDGLGETQILNGESADSADETADTEAFTTPEDAEALLMDGLQEVTGLLVGQHSVSEVFNVVLETMYRSMGFQRVLLALHDRGKGEMVGRIGFGDDVDDFVKQFRFPIKYSVDVFHGVIKNAVDVYIADTSDEKMQADIPDWYKRISDAGSFLLFPLVVNKRALGLIYADHPNSNGVEIDAKKLNLLKSLRNQIILAVRS
ncbi:MAG: HDOD domain-containing protein [gamma proteobacterium endosymbiont of Lamellibrachia anaximandri]|nr:HDOD domain-containing protein [gamma proteobacterium endosymbiont of Lamellibrachia anaximandri]